MTVDECPVEQLGVEGAKHLAAGRYAEALQFLFPAVAHKPASAGLLGNLAQCLTLSGNPGRALPFAEEAARRWPHHPNIWETLGFVQVRAGHPEAAARSYAKVLETKPDTVSVYTSLSACRELAGHGDEAISLAEYALMLDPHSAAAQFQLSLALLHAGYWERGWQFYDARFSAKRCEEKNFGTPPVVADTEMKGQRVLVWQEQGIGDLVQFSRCANALQDAGATILWHVPAEAISLFAEGTAAVDPLPHDYQISAGSLPALLRMTPQRYRRLNGWPLRLPHREPVKGRVGACWTGAPTHGWHHYRDIPPAYFDELAETLPERDFVSLVPGGPEYPGIWKLPPDADWLRTANRIAECELVISTDTGVVHLAAAMGVPVWLLLSTASEWRWGYHGNLCPWYPGVRYFRQRELDNWAEVFQRVEEALHDAR